MVVLLVLKWSLMKKSLLMLVLMSWSAFTYGHNLAIFLDTFETEPISSDIKELVQKAVTFTFAAALCQGNFFIITTSNIFGNFLKLKSLNTEQLNGVSLDKWNIYKTNTNDFYLFIPKSLVNSEVQKLFAINSLETVQGTATVNLLSSIQRKSTLIIENLENIFNQSKDTIPWNIFLNGHGSSPKINPDSIGSNIKFDESKALIGGLSLSNFRNFLQFLIQKINTGFFYLISCFAGDINLTLPFITTWINQKGNIIGGIKKPNFTVVSGALTSEPVVSNVFDTLYLCRTNSAITKGIMNFKLFFELLDKYGRSTNGRPSFNKAQLTEILNSITPRAKNTHDPNGISGLPSVLFPNTDNFQVISLDEKIFIISQVVVKKYMLDKKLLVLKNKEAILIYPDIIPININIETSSNSVEPSIVSMTQGIGLQRIKEISTNLRLTQFINAFTHVKPAFNKYFFIEKLVVVEDRIDQNNMGQSITLNNVLILVKKDSVSMIFTQEESICLYTEKEFNNNMAKFQQITSNAFLNSILNYFVILKNSDVKKAFNFDLLQNILPKKDVQKLTGLIKNLDQLIHANTVNEKIKNLMELIKEKIDTSSLQKYLYSLKIHLIQEYVGSKQEKYQLAAIALILLEYFANGKSFNEIDNNLPKDLQEKLKTLQDKVKENIDSKGIESYINSLKIQAIQEFLSDNSDEYNLFAIQIYLLEYFLNKGIFTDLPKEAGEKIVEFNEKIKEQIKSKGIDKYLENLKVHAMDEFIKSQEKLDEYNFFIIYLILLESMANKKLI